MKRSEMVEDMVMVLQQAYYGTSMTERMSTLLQFMESQGMLPPTIEKNGHLADEWEPED